jgi:hypothetical protein
LGKEGLGGGAHWKGTDGGTPERIRDEKGSSGARGGVVGVIDEQRGGGVLGVGRGCGKEEKEASMAPQNQWAHGVKRRGRGPGSGRDHVEKEGGRVGMGMRWVDAVDRHDTDAVAPGCSDSGGRRTPRGHGGSGM